MVLQSYSLVGRRANPGMYMLPCQAVPLHADSGRRLQWRDDLHALDWAHVGRGPGLLYADQRAEGPGGCPGALRCPAQYRLRAPLSPASHIRVSPQPANLLAASTHPAHSKASLKLLAPPKTMHNAYCLLRHICPAIKLSMAASPIEHLQQSASKRQHVRAPAWRH